mgnify:CR=1 FL=1
MRTIECITCSSHTTKKNGKTVSGKQRYYCLTCHSSFTHAYDSTFKDFALFLNYVTDNHSQKSYSLPERTLRYKTRKFWAYWPLPPQVRKHYDIVFVDGIYINRKTVILIACTPHTVLGWYIARSETATAYTALLTRIAAPVIVVSDGGQGFRKACKNVWPHTKIQRCLFHVYLTIKNATTLHPRLLAGQELLMIGRRLLHIKTLDHARQWLVMYNTWYDKWEHWLKQQTLVNTRYQDTHAKLAQAARSMNTLIRQGQMFTNLQPEYLFSYKDTVITTNNQIEGGVNTQLRSLLRAHRGTSLNRQIKTVFWYCYTHSTASQDPHEYLKTMPTDTDIARAYHTLYEQDQWLNSIPSWGDVAVYNEFHVSKPWTYDD